MELDLIDYLTRHRTAQKWLATAVMMLVSLSLRWAILRMVREQARLSMEARRRWIVYTRNFMLGLMTLGMMIIWAAQLRTVALSFVAIAMALVIALKELIQCMSGGLVRSMTRAFEIGDRIEMQNYRGDVIDTGLFTTTLLEVGPGQSSHQLTGRAVVLPNSLFLSSPVNNESFTDAFVLHHITIPLRIEDQWQRAEALLLSAAQLECSTFVEDARESLERQSRRQGIDSPGIDPRVSIQLPEPGRLNLLLRVPAPTRQRGRLEQAILRRYLSMKEGNGGMCEDKPGEPEEQHAADQQDSAVEHSSLKPDL